MDFLIIFLGFLTGIVISVAGVSAAFLTPILLLFNLKILEIIGTVLIFNTIAKFSSLLLIHNFKFDKDKVILVSLSSFSASLLTFVLLQSVKPKTLITIIFFTLVFLFIIRYFNIKISTFIKDFYYNFKNKRLLFVIYAFLTTIITSLTSIGSGIISSILFRNITNHEKATAYSLFFGWLIGLFSSIPYVTTLKIDIKLLTLLLLGYFLSVPLARRLKRNKLLSEIILIFSLLIIFYKLFS